MQTRINQIIGDLRKKHGSSWKKRFTIKRNYPFGMKSRSRITIESRKKNGRKL